MLKFWRRLKQENSGEYKFPITKKWFDKANLHSPVPGREYEWVWDYAQMRFATAEQARRQVEDKSLMTLKFASIIAAGAWAVFVFVGSRGDGFSFCVKVFASIACLCLVAAALLAVLAFAPGQHVLPIDEEAALECVETLPTKDEAIGKFCMGLTASTERENELVSKKGLLLCWALGALVGSVVCFSLSLLFAAYR
jgi:hypothetical protein